jgi:hypothetical protein
MLPWWTGYLQLLVGNGLLLLALLAGGGILCIAGGFRLGLLGLLLAIFAGLRRVSLLVNLALDCLAVGTLNIRMRGSDTGKFFLVPATFRGLDLIASFVDNASLSFVFGLELDLTLKSLDLLRIQQVAILIAVLDLLLLGEDTVLLILNGSSGNFGFILLVNRRGGLVGLNLVGWSGRNHRFADGGSLTNSILVILYAIELALTLSGSTL